MTIKERVLKNIEFMKKQVDKGFGMYVITFSRNGRVEDVILPMATQGKDRSEGLNKEIVGLKTVAKFAVEQSLKVESIMCMAKAWVATRDKKDIDQVVDKDGIYKEGAIKPSEDPNRKEVVLCSGMDAEGNTSIISFEIKSQEFEGMVVRTLKDTPQWESHCLANDKDKFMSTAFTAFFESYNAAKNAS